MTRSKYWYDEMAPIPKHLLCKAYIHRADGSVTRCTQEHGINSDLCYLHEKYEKGLCEPSDDNMKDGEVVMQVSRSPLRNHLDFWTRKRNQGD